MELSQGIIIQKPKMQELSSLFMTHCLSFEYIPYDRSTIWNLSQGIIIQKPKMQELYSLFMTHCINVMHALVKFHEYIPYSLGVMARTQLTIWNLVKGK